jgi:hypothetical protein
MPTVLITVLLVLASVLDCLFHDEVGVRPDGFEEVIDLLE